MKFPEFEKQLAAFKKYLEMAYAQGFDDAADAILAGAQARVMGQPQPQVPMPRPEAVPQRQFSPRGWTQAEDDFLREAWGKIPFRELSRTYNRSPGAIRVRGKVIGLPKLHIGYQFPEAGQ
jgi:hypothetical protein